MNPAIAADRSRPEALLPAERPRVVSALRLLAITGYAAAVQLTAGIAVLALGRWPVLGWVVLIAWLAFLVHAATSRHLLAGLPWWQAALVALGWQAPALVFGMWNLAAFLGWVRPLDIGCFVLQLWHAVVVPLIDCCPRREWRGVGLYLWLWSAGPLLLAVAQMLLRRPR